MINSISCSIEDISSLITSIIRTIEIFTRSFASLISLASKRLDSLSRSFSRAESRRDNDLTFRALRLSGTHF